METLLDRVVARALGPHPRPASGTRLRQRGTLRLAPDKPWTPFEATQTIDARRTAFRWVARIRQSALVRVQVIDALEEGRGRLDVRLWGLLPVARARRSPELDAGELLRYLAELPWCPHAYRHNPAIEVAAEGDGRLRVTGATEAGRRSLALTVDAASDVTAMHAEARPRLEGKVYVTSPWSATFAEHAALDGVRVPRRGTVTWHLPDGPFECWRGEITELTLLP